MGYKKRYKRRRSGDGWGSAISDVAGIASKFGPKGALITGVAGFIFFYLIIPWILVEWAEHNKAKMTGQHAAIFGKLLDDIFVRRFIHPSEWVGIAILLICTSVACWKVVTRTDLDRSSQRDVTSLGKLLARFLD